MELAPALKGRIESLIKQGDVVLFMKGTRQAPRCGFSAAVVEILDELIPDYATVDVLADPEVREGIKVYSSWPTLPQLYVKGELIGGADIAKEMYGTGELQKKLGVPTTREAPTTPMSVTITETAATALRQALADAGGDVLRLAVSARFQHQLGFGAPQASDRVCESQGVTIHVDGPSAKRANGIVIDAVQTPQGLGFKIENPNEPKTVKQIGARSLKEKLDAAKNGGPRVELFDVRTPGELAIAHVEGARLLDDAGRTYLESLPKDTPLVFICHHGGRSNGAAQHYLGLGFTDVANVAGGIDAWSAEVDPSVPRY